MTLRDLRGAAGAGWFLIAEGAVTGAAALLFAGYAATRAGGYAATADDSGVGALVIVLGFAIALVLAAFAPAAILLGRAVRRGSHPAWVAALPLSGAQILVAAAIWPLAAPLGAMGAIAVVLLLLPEARAECSPPPVLGDEAA